MDPIQHHALTGIERLERELIVRDFTSLITAGAFEDASRLLHEDVVYRPSPNQRVRGRNAVIEMCMQVREAFEDSRTELDTVAVTEDVVVAEQTLHLKLAGHPAQQVMGFASYRMDGFQIIEWRQLHG